MLIGWTGFPLLFEAWVIEKTGQTSNIFFCLAISLVYNIANNSIIF